MKKKIEKSIIFVMLILFLVCGSYLCMKLYLEIGIWSKTEFKDYQAFQQFLGNNRVYETFMDELPDSAKDVKYHWYKSWNVINVSYSVVLSEEEYHCVKEERLEFYRAEEKKRYGEILEYALYDKEYLYVEDSEWIKEYLPYLKEVLLQPETAQSYYLLVLARTGSPRGEGVNGVILNDNTYEVVEFCVEYPD